MLEQRNTILRMVFVLLDLGVIINYVEQVAHKTFSKKRSQTKNMTMKTAQSKASL